MKLIVAHRWKHRVDVELEVEHREAYLRLRDGANVSPDAVVTVTRRVYQILLPDGNATTHNGRIRSLRNLGFITTDIGGPLTSKMEDIKKKKQ